MRLATRVAVPGKDAAAARESGGKDAESAFALTPQSFRRFRESDANEGGFFLRGLWFITRARTMTGMDAKVRGCRSGAIRSRSRPSLSIASARSRLARAGFLFEKFAPRADVSGAR